MTVLPIVYSDDPLLRKRSHAVRRITPEIRQLVDDMIETMRTNNGIGLAAIQVGVPQRVIVVEMPSEPDEEDDEDAPPRPSQLYVLINPEFARQSRQMEDGIEGCLSVPGFVGEVSRHQRVTIKGMDLRGKAVRIRADGWLARVFQHETDHCNGVLFIDHIDDPEKIWPVAEGEEELAEATQSIPGHSDQTSSSSSGSR
ncbi:MAG: peptide deformylase [Chloroflexi bacterium]|nr:peptide deformylase [Chloroflexota bacterium]